VKVNNKILITCKIIIYLIILIIIETYNWKIYKYITLTLRVCAYDDILYSSELGSLKYIISTVLINGWLGFEAFTFKKLGNKLDPLKVLFIG